MKVIAWSITKQCCGMLQGLTTGNLPGIQVCTASSFSLSPVQSHSESVGNQQVSDLVLTCPTLPPLALNSESPGVTRQLLHPSEEPSCFPQPLISAT